MRLMLDTTGVSFLVTRNPEPKNDQNGQQKHRQKDGAPMWSTQVTALDGEGAEVFAITVAGVKPEAMVGEYVTPVGLEAIPWNTNGRHGTAFRAESLGLVEVKAASK